MDFKNSKRYTSVLALVLDFLIVERSCLNAINNLLPSQAFLSPREDELEYRRRWKKLGGYTRVGGRRDLKK